MRKIMICLIVITSGCQFSLLDGIDMNNDPLDNAIADAKFVLSTLDMALDVYQEINTTNQYTEQVIRLQHRIALVQEYLDTLQEKGILGAGQPPWEGASW